jgi:hypothetical protein
MTRELRLVRTEPDLTKKRLPKEARIRNLGSAIFLTAIQDYRSLNEDTHKDAERFLYPQTPDSQDHYDWAVGLMEGLDPAWLRSSLDRFKGRWDGQRFARMGSARPIRKPCKPKKKGSADEARKCS